MTYKHWLILDRIDFNTFINLRQSGVEINISSRPDDIKPMSNEDKFETARVRFIEAITTTENQELLLLLSCNKLKFMEVKK